MSIGTKSLLFGYHQFLIHPLALACAWIKLYGWPDNWRIWIAFFVHDLGYAGKTNMDGPQGETHPYFGARLMCAFFDPPPGQPNYRQWYDFMLYHSRTLARADGVKPSRLCYADKMAIIMQPAWLQLLLMTFTGEWREYMKGQGGRTAGEGMTRLQWIKAMQQHLREWFNSEGYSFKTETWIVKQVGQTH